MTKNTDKQPDDFGLIAKRNRLLIEIVLYHAMLRSAFDLIYQID